MTSPTTSADAEYHVSVLRELSATLIDRSPSRHAAIEYAIATLAQHAEAGAVVDTGGLLTDDESLSYAGQRKVVEHMTVEIREAIALLHSIQSRAEAIDCQPIPAQPASQQGERLQRWGRGPEPHPYLLQRLEDGYWTPWHIAQAAVDAAASPHPTGDKVRALLKSCKPLAAVVSMMGDHQKTSTECLYGINGTRFTFRDMAAIAAIAAALDQEKNDGR